MEVRDSRYNDIRLTFKEENHSYTDSIGNKYLSTTTMLHRYAQEFDKEYWLKYKAKELHISEKELEKQWSTITKEAQEEGTRYHNGLEDGIKGSSMFTDAVRYMTNSRGEMVTVADIPNINEYVKPLDIQDFIEATENKYSDIYKVFRYYLERDYKIYSEIGAFLIDFLVSGCIDVLCLREDQFVIGDWKTNRGGLKFQAGYYKKDKSVKPYQETKTFVHKNEFLKPPVSHLENCNGNIYNLQLSQYAFFVEYILNIPCAGLWLCHIDRDFVLNQYGMPRRFPDGLYHVKQNPEPKTTFYKMKYLRDEICAILKDRYLEVQAGAPVKSLFNEED